MTIEKVTIEDAEKLLEIYTPYVKDTAVSFEIVPPSTEEFRERIKTISAKFPYIKAVENGEILGYAYAGTFRTRAAYNRNVETTIYLRKDARRKGIGRALYTALEDSLRKMGILNLNACITSPRGEDPYLTADSIKFHEKMGYSLVGVFHDSGYKFNRWYDMLWMEKMLGEHTENPKEVTFGKWDIG